MFNLTLISFQFQGWAPMAHDGHQSMPFWPMDYFELTQFRTSRVRKSSSPPPSYLKIEHNFYHLREFYLHNKTTFIIFIFSYNSFLPLRLKTLFLLFSLRWYISLNQPFP